MDKRSKVTAMLSVLLVSAPTTAKKITTSNLRDNAMRTDAVEVDNTNSENVENYVTETKKSEGDLLVLDTNKLKFDYNSANIKDEYNPILEKVKKYIEEKNLKVSIIGYTDSKGTKSYNKELSLRRAESVEERLIDLGLSPERIIETVGKGDSNPIASNDDEDGRAKNRRVEFKLVKRGAKEVNSEESRIIEVKKEEVKTEN